MPIQDRIKEMHERKAKARLGGGKERIDQIGRASCRERV